MSKRIVLLAAAAVVAVGLAVQAATASPTKHVATRSTHLLVGMNDEPDTLYGDPATAFATLKSLKVQVLRVNMYWGGNKWAVANTKPADATDPGDPAYNWALYDRLVAYAHTYNIPVMFSILFTPSWANGGQARTVAPTNMQDLQNFARAAAERYSGLWTPPSWQRNAALGIGNGPLPKVSMWTAWNEPNNPIWLTPQYKKVGSRWVIQSAKSNTRRSATRSITECTRPTSGHFPESRSHAASPARRETTRPRPTRRLRRPAHVPERGEGGRDEDVRRVRAQPVRERRQRGSELRPEGQVRSAQVQLGNINVLLAKITQLYGPKHLWITEYGYQTNPPDKTIFGTSWANQAKYMSQAYAIARKNPRIDMMVWFLVRDEPNLGGWQSGLETVAGKKKPSWKTYLGLPRG